MNGVPAAVELQSLGEGNGGSAGMNKNENVIRLSIDAALKNTDGDTVARLVQEGFSEIAVTSGGKVFEY